MNTFTWLIRREFWENRAIWAVPAAMAAVLILLTLFGRADFDLPPMADQHRAVGGAVLFVFGLAFYVVMTIYSTWYLLDCLYADRKDRSILFWKSLPISDAQTVLSKLSMALVVIPLVYFLAADVTTLMCAFIISVRARANVGTALWHPDLWLQLQALWMYLIVTAALWYLPFSGWMLIVSAWAKRAVMLWTILPPLALWWLEHWFLRTNYIGSALAERALGYGANAFHAGMLVNTRVGEGSISAPESIWGWMNPSGFFSNVQTWVGLGLGVALVAAAVQLRLRRTEP
jgi:ABC-2 type transport system permease protein